MILDRIHNTIHSVQQGINQLKKLPTQKDSQDLGTLNPLHLRHQLHAVHLILGKKFVEELKLIQTVIHLKNQLIEFPLLKIWLQQLNNKQENLDENWVRQAGRLLWNNRNEIIQRKSPEMEKCRPLLLGLLEKIKSSSAKDKTKEFARDLIHRALTPELPLELYYEILRRACPRDAIALALSHQLDKADTHITGFLLAKALNHHNLFYSDINKFHDLKSYTLPDFEESVLPHLQDVDLSQGTLLNIENFLNQLVQHDKVVNSLYLPDDYNSPVPETLLDDLKVFEMGEKYNQPLPKELKFSNLKKLVMGKFYNQPLPEKLDLSSLEVFIMGERYTHPIPKNLNLSSLKTLILSPYYEDELLKELNLSSSVEIIRLVPSWMQDTPTQIVPLTC